MGQEAEWEWGEGGRHAKGKQAPRPRLRENKQSEPLLLIVIGVAEAGEWVVRLWISGFWLILKYVVGARENPKTAILFPAGAVNNREHTPEI